MCGLELLGDVGGCVILMLILVRDSTELCTRATKAKSSVLGSINIRLNIKTYFPYCLVVTVHEGK